MSETDSPVTTMIRAWNTAIPRRMSTPCHVALLAPRWIPRFLKSPASLSLSVPLLFSLTVSQLDRVRLPSNFFQPYS
ncbi:hypothetical protein N656DRAFT_378337 [Canariomyces notabilis]|uniref:Uncharacterized protein n=1 Tax=Canariomyces notabilis TaxID=2074819 RepID=A0AAN6YVV5_9PEZI|nr:hypothetical protein N656DRAFT_378337 [Canariomyces arenarius]